VNVCLLSEVTIGQADGQADVEEARRLMRAYAAWLAVDLCFQGFEHELSALPGAYAPPAGRLLLAKAGGDVIGCAGLRPLEPGICEMKRLWVEPGFSGAGIGRRLAESIVLAARDIGYRKMRLDTLPERMPAAQHLYRSLGFGEIPAYYDNPLPGVTMLELTLWTRTSAARRGRPGPEGSRPRR
jgi:ribosomal protein S18 acetylase RimI-like enzyme